MAASSLKSILSSSTNAAIRLSICAAWLGLKFPFLQILPTVAFLYFFRADSTNFPDCIQILPQHICFF